MELAIKLGKSLAEIKMLSAAEFYQWHAFLSLKPDDHVSVEDKLRAIFGKPKDA